MHYFDAFQAAVTQFVPSNDQLGRFRKWHVEPLLNQSADLLDRCLAGRESLSALEAKKAELELDIGDRFALHQLASERIKQGLYRRGKEVLKAQSSTIADVAGELKEAGRLAAEAKTNISSPSHDFEIRWRQINVESHKTSFEQKTSEMKGKWEDIDEAYFTAVHNQENIALNARHQLFNEGALDYASQAKGLSARIARDFDDAYTRAAVAADGLTEIFGYGVGMPKAGTEDRLDLTVKWVRDAIEWINAFSQLDQSFVVRLSLGELLTATSWAEVATTKQFFHVPSNLFRDHTHIRLRGISCQLPFDYPLGSLWSARITLPVLASYIFEYENGKPRVESVALQRELPSCYVGRLESISCARAPDLAGTVSLMNASPIGKDKSEESMWSIKLVCNSERQLNLPPDALLELTLCGRPCIPGEI